MSYKVISQVLGQSPQPNGAVKFCGHLRRLWADHTIWTRMYIVGTLGHLGDEQVSKDRLLRNAGIMGQAFQPFVGSQNALRLSRLFRDHVTLTCHYVVAVRDHKPCGPIEESLDANVRSTAKTLSSLNPRWPEDGMIKLLRESLRYDVQQVSARMAQDWDRDANAFELSLSHAMRLADVMASGMLGVLERAVTRQARRI